MSLSQKLEELSVKAKNLEESAAKTRNESNEKLELRLAELDRSFDEMNAQVDEAVDETNAALTEAWTEARGKVTGHFADVKKKMADSRADREAKHSARRIEDADWQAEIAVDFAVYAIQEAEYAIINAAIVRAQEAE